MKRRHARSSAENFASADNPLARQGISHEILPCSAHNGILPPNSDLTQLKGPCMESRIFISYGREDQDAARRLYDDLKSAGLDPWLDDVDLLPGQNWRQTINRVIKESRYVLTLLSSKSLFRRGHVQKELKTGWSASCGFLRQGRNRSKRCRVTGAFIRKRGRRSEWRTRPSPPLIAA